MIKDNTSTVMVTPKILLENQINIRIATTPEEKMAIYRFRYKIYAEEIEFKLVTIDHENKLLFDELDEWGILLYAKLNTEIIGTARVNIGRYEDFPSELAENYLMDKFKFFYGANTDYKLSVASKGMVAPAYRSSPVLNLLMAKLYELYCENNVNFAFINCNFHLIPLHEHYGSQRLNKNILDPNLGPMTNFVLLVDDVKHLQTVGSPLFHIANKRKILNRKSVNWFHSTFNEVLNNTTNSQLVTENKFWSILCDRLGHPPNKVLYFLYGLTETEAKKFLYSCSVIVPCNAGDYLTNRNDVSQELNVLLSGKIQAHNILPGDHFGEIGLVNRTRYTESITAATTTEILVLSYHYFRKFSRSFPHITNKVLKNLNIFLVTQS